MQLLFMREISHCRKVMKNMKYGNRIHIFHNFAAVRYFSHEEMYRQTESAQGNRKRPATGKNGAERHFRWMISID